MLLNLVFWYNIYLYFFFNYIFFFLLGVTIFFKLILFYLLDWRIQISVFVTTQIFQNTHIVLKNTLILILIPLIVLFFTIFYWYKQRFILYLLYFIILLFSKFLVSGIIWAMFEPSWDSWWFGEDLEEILIFSWFWFIVAAIHIFSSNVVFIFKITMLSTVCLMVLFNFNFMFITRHITLHYYMGYYFIFIIVFILKVYKLKLDLNYRYFFLLNNSNFKSVYLNYSPYKNLKLSFMLIYLYILIFYIILIVYMMPLINLYTVYIYSLDLNIMDIYYMWLVFFFFMYTKLNLYIYYFSDIFTYWFVNSTLNVNDYVHYIIIMYFIILTNNIYIYKFFLIQVLLKLSSYVYYIVTFFYYTNISFLNDIYLTDHNYYFYLTSVWVIYLIIILYRILYFKSITK